MAIENANTINLLRNIDQKSIEKMFSIAICRPTGDKWQAKTLFLSIFDPRTSIVDYIFDCRLPGVTHLDQFLYCLHLRSFNGSRLRYPFCPLTQVIVLVFTLQWLVNLMFIFSFERKILINEDYWLIGFFDEKKSF